MNKTPENKLSLLVSPLKNKNTVFFFSGFLRRKKNPGDLFNGAGPLRRRVEFLPGGPGTSSSFHHLRGRGPCGVSGRRDGAGNPGSPLRRGENPFKMIENYSTWRKMMRM